MHAFVAGTIDKAACVHCKRPLRDHTAIAQCECCPRVGPCEIFGSMLMCKVCYEAETKAQAESKATAEARVAASREATLAQQKEHPVIPVNELAGVDQTMTLVSDIHNAQTKALMEVIKSINDDPSIDNKPYARSKATLERIKKYQSLIFDLENQLLDAKHGLRVSTVYLNQTINELRESERAEFKQADITYPVKSPKPGKPKSTGTKKAKASTKVDMAEVQKWATKIGQSMNAVHALMIQHGVDAKGAARILCGLMGKDFPEDK